MVSVSVNISLRSGKVQHIMITFPVYLM